MTLHLAAEHDLIASDISAYLEKQKNKELLRFITCGSVDDGKSTLIGRLLYDTRQIFDDQMAALEADSPSTSNAKSTAWPCVPTLLLSASRLAIWSSKICRVS